MALGDRLRQVRFEHQLTAKDAGALVGKSHTTWGNWEKGITRPSFEDITNIAQMFGVTRTWLDTGMGEKSEEEAKKKAAELEAKRKDEAVNVHTVEDEERLRDIVTCIGFIKDMNIPKERKRRIHRTLSAYRTELENVVLFGEMRG